ncbi:PilZ domain-containing protein [Methylorubrum aminovorans]|uniref:PilZ domain-containing protein n=1 Tax=Methylorubrum aminovorans TaxID=269069 RepID=UPI003C2D4943
MVEQRRAARYSDGRPARIVPRYGKALSCRIVDRSETGARLRVDSVFGIPDLFLLEVSESDERYWAAVVWKEAQQLGVQLSRPEFS